MHQHMRIHKAEPNVGALDSRHLLEAPAGRHGFVTAKKGHLYFEDGARVRFIGYNLPTRSNTPDHETAEKLAERFASLGVNVIRLHAADAPIGDEPASWSSCREAPLMDYESGSSRHFHKEGLDRFDYFVAKLKEKGVYLHIDLIVARAFREGDGLDYPGEPDSCFKCYGLVNERLIELQQEYARALLCHVNPYTGLRLVDDPAVMTVQINNEDSAIKEGQHDTPASQPYRDELQRKFNHFLLMKYDTRAKLAAAWTHDGVCALRDEEDPAQGTVSVVEGSFLQVVNEPTSAWNGNVSPARYADWQSFGIQLNRAFYQRMKDFLRSLGVRVPIATSNLLGGAADVYGHSDADVMENNTYFNHPLFPLPGPNLYTAPTPAEYASVDPLTMQRGLGSMATTLLSLAVTSAVAGKPFLLSEWNEYGLHPFHSTSFLSVIAYACLNDWDGLILYCHHTSEKLDDQPADEILNVFDFYNDPALMCQWHFLADVFLSGRIAPAAHRADVVYTQNDLLTLPNAQAMPNTFLPYVTGMRQVFLDGGEHYQGDADVAVNAGFLNGCDLSDAAHGVYYAWSPYRDAFRRALEPNRLKLAAEGTREIAAGVHLGEKTLVFDDIRQVAGSYDYRDFAAQLDTAMKQWGVLPEGTGYVDGKLVSETGEIVTDAPNARFAVNTPACACFSGTPDGQIALGDLLTVQPKNERVTLTLLPEKCRLLADAKSFLLTAIGTTGMDETTMTPTAEWNGIQLNLIHMQGKLFADTLEGDLLVACHTAELELLDTTGHVLATLQGEKAAEGVRFRLDGAIPSVNFRLSIS